MDTLAFIAELVKALAWPVLIAFLVFVLRKPVKSLIPLLTSLKYKDLELEFGRRIEEAKAVAETELEEDLVTIAERLEGEERITRIVEASPRAGVLEAWSEIEQETLAAARRILEKAGEDVRRLIPQHAIRVLKEREVIDAPTVNLLLELRRLRNQAAHAPGFALSAGSALEYALLSKRLVRRLRAVDPA